MARTKRRWALFVLAAGAAAAVVAWVAWRGPLVAGKPVAPVVEPARSDPAYATTIQPLFDRRCVVCHACFDSPCQLNLQSWDGLDRGANAQPVYEPSRLTPMHPTRMFQDARTTAEWRSTFGFFPVIARPAPAAVDLGGTLLWRTIEQRRAAGGGGPFDVDKGVVCPASIAAMNAAFRARPERGMPFGFPALDDGDAKAIGDWLRRGGGGAGPAPDEAPATQAEIARWEAFFAGRDDRTRLVARYVFEHLFFAHLSLSSAPGEWFRLVRSRTEAPAPVDEIATVRPYDDPGAGPVHYRLRRVRETIVEKTHVPYRLDDAKLARLRHLFFDADWGSEPVAFPSYAREVAANPFVAFRSIPARSRYQFLLDDAHYHVKTFIHGPVCRGQVALDVIDEHFLVFFLSPDADPSVTRADYLPRFAADLAVPAEGGDGVEAIYERFKVLDLAYLAGRAQLLRDTHAPGRALADIWDGGGTNRDAVLTVYRHFDSAFVLRGAIGGLPKTAWVLDYPIFERMYYDLVAGFDVYGNVVHQVSTRRYMNLLRIEAEAGFLAFLPASQRAAVRASWYRPLGVSKIVDVLDPVFVGPDTRVAFADPARAKDELLMRLLTPVGSSNGRSALPAAVVGPREAIQWRDLPLDGDTPAARFERAARTFAAAPGPFTQAFPDAALVRVRTSGPGAPDDPVYTLIRNKAHLNIDFMFLEDEERAPAEDTLHVVPGIAVSKPNLFFTVDAADVDRFAADLRALAPGNDSWARFVARYAARRSDPAFWATSDFFNARFTAMDPVQAGVLDLSRYTND